MKEYKKVGPKLGKNGRRNRHTIMLDDVEYQILCILGEQSEGKAMISPGVRYLIKFFNAHVNGGN